MKKAVFTAASPNNQRDDALLAFRLLFQPGKWQDAPANQAFTQELSDYMNIPYVELIDSGRSALYTILQSFGVKSHDEVILPSFTCVVVANAVRWTGATPVYLDTNQEDYNAQYSLIQKHITDKTKVVVVQHTFGKLVDIEAIRKKLKKIQREDIRLIEDFAHVITKNMPLTGDAGFTTFGIEKVISTVRGGAIMTRDKAFAQEVKNRVNQLPQFPRLRVWISLLNPIFWWFAIPLHSFGFGRFTIGAFIRTIWRKLGFLGIMVEEKENRAEKPSWFPCRMSGALSTLGIKQLKKLDTFNDHRRRIAEIYDTSLRSLSDDSYDAHRVYLRYPITFTHEGIFIKAWDAARAQRVTPGNWFAKPLYGSSVDQKTYNTLCYVPASTPETLQKTKATMNLPTSINISEKRARELAEEIEDVIAQGSENASSKDTV